MFDKQIVRLAFVGTKSLIVCSSLTKELGQEQKYTKFLQNEGWESPRFQPWDDRPTIMVFFVSTNIIVM